MDGGLVLVALGLVMLVIATSHHSARLGRLRVAVGDLARSAERFGVGVARVGRR